MEDVPLCTGPGACNPTKHARDPVAWLQERLGPLKAKPCLVRISAFLETMREKYEGLTPPARVP